MCNCNNKSCSIGSNQQCQSGSCCSSGQSGCQGKSCCGSQSGCCQGKSCCGSQSGCCQGKSCCGSQSGCCSSGCKCCQQGSCPCAKGSCCCSKGSCCGSKQSSCPHQAFADRLLGLADEAWMDLLKEKIKAEIEKQASEQLNQLAALVSSANHKRWKNKMGEKGECDDFKEQLKNLFRQQRKG